MTKRLESIDALRGLAIVLMAVNHAGHYLTPIPHPGWAYLAIYLTVTLAAPLFLFLAGFSLALSQAKSMASGFSRKGNYYLKRGLALVGLGVLINLFFYNQEPLWRGRVLLTIGLSIILAQPFLLLAADKLKRRRLFGLCAVGLMLFPVAYPALKIFSDHYPFWSEIFLSEFPIYPWFLLVLAGLIAGWEYLEHQESARQARLMLLAAGASALALWLAATITIFGGRIFSFANDFNLNGYWNPSPLTWLWIGGWISIMVALFNVWEVAKARSQPRNILAVIGSKSLLMYFLQFFLIITVGRQLWKLEIYDIIPFVISIIIIILILWISAKSSSSASATA